jgi:hypothetical protein
MSSLLDFSFDDVADLAPQGNPPTGTYECKVVMALDPAKNDKAPQVRLNWTISGIHSQSPSADSAPEAVEGQTFTTWHGLDMVSKSGSDATPAMITRRLLMPLIGKYGVSKAVDLAPLVDDEVVVAVKWSKPISSAGKEPKRFFNVESITLA